MAPITVEVWSDVVCPWCYVGKRHFEAALAQFPRRDEIGVVWRSFELDAPAGKTFDAHRMIHLAAAGGRQDAALERLMRAALTESEPIDDAETLVRLIGEVGVDTEAAQAVLASDQYADAVREDERLAERIGIRGVPYFVLDRRFGVSGAQPAEVLVQALERACS